MIEQAGLIGAENKFPHELSGGMRKRAGLARALVLEPEVVLFDEPDAGLDPVRVSYLNQFIVDLNARIDATFFIVTHDIASALELADNMGMLYAGKMITFDARERVMASQDPVVRQFLTGRMQGPIGMAEEKDAAQIELEREQKQSDFDTWMESHGVGTTPRLLPSPGIPRSRRWEEIASRQRTVNGSSAPRGSHG
jgi:phospholipid/cholesterol/gamma-HCH transport system ATP-binding protein